MPAAAYGGWTCDAPLLRTTASRGSVLWHLSPRRQPSPAHGSLLCPRWPYLHVAHDPTSALRTGPHHATCPSVSPPHGLSVSPRRQAHHHQVRHPGPQGHVHEDLQRHGAEGVVQDQPHRCAGQRRMRRHRIARRRRALAVSASSPTKERACHAPCGCPQRKTTTASRWGRCSS
jgi:hypothetical protein